MRVVTIAGLMLLALAVGVEVWWDLGADRAGEPGAGRAEEEGVRAPDIGAVAPAGVQPGQPVVPPAPVPPAAPAPAPVSAGTAAGADAAAVQPVQPPGQTQPIPLPPMPPRIASGADYERCLGMLPADPVGANAFAEAWDATGGGDAAKHCRAAALISLGRMAAGAELLEALARASAAPALARAFIYGQATQAWLLAGDAQRAYASATLAMTLAPEDVDLIIDRSIAAATMARYLDAIDDLSLALARDPRRIDALVFRAAAWRHDGQLGLANDDIARALALDPDYPEALLERGILRQRRGDLDGARADWQRVLAVATDGATVDMAEQNLNLLDVGPGRRP